MDTFNLNLVNIGGNFPESRERRLKLLEERKSRYEESELCEFSAEEALIGLIIGKQGEKLTRIAWEHKVEIRVLPDDAGLRRVRIYGPDRQSVQRARNVLEYVYHEYSVSESMVGWVLAKKGGCLKDVQQKAGLHSAWYDEVNQIIVLCGLRHSIEQAIHMLDSNAHHFYASPSTSPLPTSPQFDGLIVDAEELEACALAEADAAAYHASNFNDGHPNDFSMQRMCGDGLPNANIRLMQSPTDHRVVGDDRESIGALMNFSQKQQIPTGDTSIAYIA